MWSEFFSVLSAIAFLLSVAACWFAARSVAQLQELLARLKDSPVSRLDSVERSIEELAVSLGELANRVKMIKVRRAADHTSEETASNREPGEPDWQKEPERWRAWQNKRLSHARRN